MKKKYPFTKMSTKRCSKCNRPLKLRIVETKEPHNITRCYQCDQMEKNREKKKKLENDRKRKVIISKRLGA